MRYPFQLSIFLGICIFLLACGPASQVTSTPVASPSAASTQTITPFPTQTATAALPPTPTRAYPTLLPTIDPESVRELLRKSIAIQTLKGVNGHTVRQITGWDYGFRQQPCDGYQWLDSNHLLLYPRTGEGFKPAMDSSIRADVGSEPVVINLTGGNFWLRPPSSVSTYEWDCESIYWSRELGIIINQQQYGTTFGPVKEAVFTYTFDGQQVAEYWGKIHGVSPRGEKILVDEDTIIDLRNNTITDLAWHMNYDAGDSPTLYWSSDETRLYRCCFYYADLKTGKGYNFEWSDLRGMDGKPLTTSMHPHQYGHWVRNDSYFLIEWDYWTILYGDPIPLFSPSEKKYYDIAEIAEIPASVVSTSTSDVSPDGIYVWIRGYGDDGQYHGFLINLVDFKTVSYDKPIDEFEWSPDSQYAWMTIYDTSDTYVLSATEKTLTLFPADPTSDLFWRPNDHVVAFLTEQDQVLTFLDAKDMSIKRWNLPSSFHDFFWSPDGSHIALIAVDGSLWQAEYPKLEDLEQLTSPLPAVDHVEWSPDGNSIAYISGSGIYIVETTSK